jgi:hypothetical protein
MIAPVRHAQSQAAHADAATAEYGFAVRPSADDLRLARSCVTALVAEADKRILAQQEALLAPLENGEEPPHPFEKPVHIAGVTIANVFDTHVFEPGPLERGLNATFGTRDNRPLPRAIAAKVNEALGTALHEQGWEIAAAEHHADGILARVALHDPTGKIADLLELATS